MVILNAFQKSRASGFAGIAQLRHETGSGKATIVGGADVYVSDYGKLTFFPDRFGPTDLVYNVDPNYASVATLRPFFTEKLAKVGDAEKYHMIVEAGLQVDNEKAHGVQRDLNLV
jgi:hypothetical protein